MTFHKYTYALYIPYNMFNFSIKDINISPIILLMYE